MKQAYLENTNTNENCFIKAIRVLGHSAEESFFNMLKKEIYK